MGKTDGVAVSRDTGGTVRGGTVRLLGEKHVKHGKPITGQEPTLSTHKPQTTTHGLKGGSREHEVTKIPPNGPGGTGKSQNSSLPWWTKRSEEKDVDSLSVLLVLPVRQLTQKLGRAWISQGTVESSH